jgi:hypothetical protein
MWVRDRVLAWHALGSRFNLQHHKKKEPYKSIELQYENRKMRPVETIPGMGGEGIKENAGGGELTIFDIL